MICLCDLFMLLNVSVICPFCCCVIFHRLTVSKFIYELLMKVSVELWNTMISYSELVGVYIPMTTRKTLVLCILGTIPSD